ncbi:hypothetical protein CLAVI_001001 [Candidatus Clavichlamydia salmonicola]|uniref:hypothetical protein n=1 Tax=Candidatus Clavichlamydia salmonicola TaxID=469812 RepID=UPI001890DFAA|nr:hypothetical protein [Candidatus Clavichlamydia salmonicola]MBF5051358.1 hypothetical protein [Candidatus Clavichlamydia salmonicola]
MPYLTLNYFQISSQKEPTAFVVEESCVDLNEEKIETLNLLLKDILNKHLPCAFVPSSFHLNPSLHNNTLTILQDVTLSLLNSFYNNQISPNISTSLNRLANTINLCLLGADFSKFLQQIPRVSNILREKSTQNYSTSNTITKKRSQLPLPEVSLTKIPKIDMDEDVVTSSHLEDLEGICSPFSSDDEFTKEILKNYTLPELTLDISDILTNLENTPSTPTLSYKISRSKKKNDTTDSSPIQERFPIIDLFDNDDLASPLTSKLSLLKDVTDICSPFSSDDEFTKEMLKNYILPEVPFDPQDILTALEKPPSTPVSCPFIEILSEKNTFIVTRKQTSDICTSLEYLYEGIRHVLNQQIYIFDSSSFLSKAHAHQQTLSQLLSLLDDNVSLLDLIVNQKDLAACTEEHLSLTKDLQDSLKNTECIQTEIQNSVPDLDLLSVCLNNPKEISSPIPSVTSKISKGKKKKDRKTSAPAQQISSIINVPSAADDPGLRLLNTELSLQENFFIKLFFSKKKCLHLSRLVAKKYPRYDRFIQTAEECVKSATSYSCHSNIKEIKVKISKEPRELLKILYLTIFHNYILYKSIGRLKKNYEQKFVNLLDQLNTKFCKLNKKQIQAKKHSSVLLNLVNSTVKRDLPLSFNRKIYSPQYHISLRKRPKKDLIYIETPDCSGHTSGEFLRNKTLYQIRTTQFIKKILTLPTINIYTKNILHIKDQDNVSTISFVPDLYLLMQYNKQAIEKYLKKNYESNAYYQQIQSSIEDSLTVLSSFAKTHNILLSDEELLKANNPLFQIQPSRLQKKILLFFPIFHIRSYNIMKTVHYKLHYSIKKSSNLYEQKNSLYKSLHHSIKSSYKLLAKPAEKISFYPNPANANLFVPVRTKATLVQSLYSGFRENWLYYKKNQSTFSSSSKRKDVLDTLEALLDFLKSTASTLSIELPVITESVILPNLVKQTNENLQAQSLKKNIEMFKKPAYLIPLFSMKIINAPSRSTPTSKGLTYRLSYSLNNNSVSRCHGYAHARDSFKKTSKSIQKLCNEPCTDKFLFIVSIQNTDYKEILLREKFLLKTLQGLEDSLSFLSKYYPVLLEMTKKYNPKEDFEHNIALVKKTLTELGEQIPQSSPPSMLKKLLLEGIKKYKTTIPSLNDISFNEKEIKPI